MIFFSFFFLSCKDRNKKDGSGTESSEDVECAIECNEDTTIESLFIFHHLIIVNSLKSTYTVIC